MHLFRGAAQCSSLKVLKACHNELGDLDGLAAAELVGKGTLTLSLTLTLTLSLILILILILIPGKGTLHCLDLSDNHIRDRGGEAIANALAENTDLNSLSVRNNYLHEDAGSAFAAALLRNTSLRKLDVELNQFTHLVSPSPTSNPRLKP